MSLTPATRALDDTYRVVVYGPKCDHSSEDPADWDMVYDRHHRQKDLLDAGLVGIARRIDYLTEMDDRDVQECTCTRHRVCAPCLLNPSK